ncbi:MAG: carbohydrate porin, partial [Betaproteobacteria bacterium]|nr:carbohydrate porin [Betaproteobacteria bacterium]
KADDQFLNWCFMTHCAYDYAADARGYTWGMASELDWDEWSSRAGWFAMPRLPNQIEIDGSIGQHFGVNWELERRWSDGALKFLAYQGRMKLADYTQFLNQTGVFIQNAPKTDAKRGGAGLNLQQAITPEIGLFARAFWTGGHNESMAFTEADSSASIGTVFEGKLWDRALDGVGVGWARNQISHARQTFLQGGNYDLFIGDGFLVYAPESVLETYYKFGIVPGVHVTLDWQSISNPAYNQARGPINVYGIRFHGEF